MRAARILASLLSILIGTDASARAGDRPRVVVLAFDGMDANRVKTMLDAGDLPNLARLARSGTFTPILPPPLANSPICWGTLLTGVTANEHGLHDFVKRSMGAIPFPALCGPHPEDVALTSLGADEKKALAGAFEVAVDALPPTIPFARTGLTAPSLFEALDAAGVRCDGVRVPIDFPPPKLKNGRILSGLFAPDVAGGPGAWFVYTNDERATDVASTDTGGTAIKIHEGTDHALHAELLGPRDFAKCARLEQRLLDLAKDRSFSAKVARKHVEDELDEARRTPLVAPVVFTPDFAARSLAIETPARKEVVREGAWSDWFRIRFTCDGGLAIDALARFVVEDCHVDADGVDRVRVFVPPLSRTPEKHYPNVPIAEPPDFAPRLARDLGPFATLGWASCTNAFKDGEIPFATFVQSLERTMQDDEKLLLHELASSDWDFLFAATMFTDHAGHGSAVTPEDRAANTTAFGKTFAGGRLLHESYREADRIVGEVAAALRPDDTLLVLSDHGMVDFHTGVNLNSWLESEGFAVRDPNAQNAGLLTWVDWKKTRAYALGLGTIYLNLEGREPNGIVAAEDAAALKRQIISRLRALADPEHRDAAVVRDVFDGAAIWGGAGSERLPDLAVGFEAGYRASWQSTLGGLEPSVFVANGKSWRMDHCSLAPDVVPGVLFSSRALDVKTTPTALDFAPTLLDLFGVAAPKRFTGRSLVPNSGR